ELDRGRNRMSVQGPLLLVGCGKMGGAMLRGWLAAGLPAAKTAVIEPHEPAHAAIVGLGVRVAVDMAGLAPDFTPRIVVLAVKPQQMDAVLPACRRFARPGTFFLSIAAG